MQYLHLVYCLHQATMHGLLCRAVSFKIIIAGLSRCWRKKRKV